MLLNIVNKPICLGLSNKRLKLYIRYCRAMKVYTIEILFIEIWGQVIYLWCPAQASSQLATYQGQDCWEEITKAI